MMVGHVGDLVEYAAVSSGCLATFRVLTAESVENVEFTFAVPLRAANGFTNAFSG